MEPLRNFVALAALLVAPAAGAITSPGVTVRARVEVAGPSSARAAAAPDVVVWLNPRVPQNDAAAQASPPGRFRMEQKNKSFHPHLLVVPLGSSVEFPNLDPFFHNVFSQFNGKRFDLGLYEAGSTRTVRFDHEGVSYLFCNIHSKMAAVVVTLGTRYFAAARDGAAELHDVPPGDYELHVWAEGEEPAQLAAMARAVHIGPGETDLGLIRVTAPKATPSHKNKYGEDYPPEHAAPYP